MQSSPNPEERIVKPIEDAGALYTRLSITFIIACLYFGITVASTTHRLLLLGGSLQLPLLGVSISLRGFYFVAPALILGLHVHLLVQYYILVRRLIEPRTDALGDDRDFFLYPALPVLRHVLSPRTEEPWVSFLIRLGLYGIHAVLPLSILLLAHYFFLPYHSFWITLWHQLLITIDLGVLWCLFGLLPMHRDRVMREGKKGKDSWWPLDARAAKGLAIVGGLLYYTFFVAIVPGTWIELAWNEEQVCKPGLLTRNLELADEYLLDEPVTPELRAIIMGDDSGELVYPRHAMGARLKGRNLRCANLEGAKLFNADLCGADLRDARLVGADLRGANLNPLVVKVNMVQVRIPHQQPRCLNSDEIAQTAERLQRTSLDRARLRLVKLEKARLHRASFEGADLQGVDLRNLELSSANFRLASMQGADLAGADLSRASLARADLSGARLEGATLNHAYLGGARLHRADASLASFVQANLEGVMAAQAVFKVADFREARLAGSDFRRASLQGATRFRFEALDARGAHLSGVCGVGAKRLADLRFVDFNPPSPREWQELRHHLSRRMSKLPAERIKAALARIDTAEQRSSTPESLAECMGTSPNTPTALTKRQLLYLDEPRPDVLETLPPVAQQSPAEHQWDEAAFHRHLAAELLSQACDSPGLARTLLLRAMGEHHPGDLSFDLELARQIPPWLRDKECGAMRKAAREISLSLDIDLARRISWKLIEHERAGEEEH
ncbi:MAG TPA: pentapeptide repeat-containing protein [Thermoanaerobaculia bacterium]|nr:pentapeptide repeat-containing protein [Thermoanaerobaculia bacterium]